MEIVVRKNGDVTIFALNGSLDSDTSPSLEDRIFEAIQGGAHKLIVDFKDLNYISSAGLRVLNKTTKKLKQLEGRLIVCSLRDYILEVFQIAGFDYFITIVADEEKAFEELNS